MEGRCCPLAARGYSRDGKKGCEQIEYGILTDPAGRPVAVRVFPGDTADPDAFTQRLFRAVSDLSAAANMTLFSFFSSSLPALRSNRSNSDFCPSGTSSRATKPSLLASSFSEEIVPFFRNSNPPLDKAAAASPMNCFRITAAAPENGPGPSNRCMVCQR